MFLIRKIVLDLIQNIKDDPSNWTPSRCALQNTQHKIYLEFHKDGYKGGIYRFEAFNYDLVNDLNFIEVAYIAYHVRKLFPKPTLIPTRTNNPELFV